MKLLSLLRHIVSSACLLALVTGLAAAQEWPQLQHDAARSGRTADEVRPPYRARWIWLGPQQTLRNRHSNAGWSDDLDTRDGYSYPVPASVTITIAHTVQPVVSAGRVFAGSMDGKAFAIDAESGSTLWSADIPGGTIVTAAVAGTVVLFATLRGALHAFDVADGSAKWTRDLGRSVTCAPCVANGRVAVADHGGVARCFDAQSGALLWERRLPAPVQGGIAADSATFYLGAENMAVYALDASTGAIRAQHRVRGQSFRMLHPVLHAGTVWMQSCMTPAMGSEYVMETLMSDSPSFEEEEANILRWLGGDTNGGRWPEASPDWRHLHALRSSDLTERYTVACGPVEGVGMAPDPPCVDNSGRVLAWWKTRYPTLTHEGAFGTKYSIDIAAVNQATGKRERIQNGRFSNMFPGPESDNLYAMSVGGDWLWLRQDFRGTQVINLTSSEHRFVSAPIRHNDGASFFADVVYTDTRNPAVRTSQRPATGRAAPAIAGSRVYQCEEFGITCLEHAP
jgi:hypothetical protein